MIKKHHLIISSYLQNIFLRNDIKIFRIKQQATPKVTLVFKMIKLVNNLVVPKISKIIALRDQ